jgi:hypothetical protein
LQSRKTAITVRAFGNQQLLNIQNMKKLLIALTLAVLVSPVLRAQDVTAEDLDKAVKYLEKTRDGVIAATKGLSEAQWKFKAATNKWSVAEVTEHIAAAEDLIFSNVKTNVMKAPARTEKEDVKAIDALILQAVPDRTTKREAPEPLVPTNRFGTPAEALKHFQESRAKTIAFLKSTKDLRDHATDSPLGKKLDGYEWLLFISAHSERHTKQIEEVKADPNFPKM